MILYSGLESIVESLYLGIPLTQQYRKSCIVLNPLKSTYLVSKTIIINKEGWDISLIDDLLRNSCTIISRQKLSDPRVKVIPYLPRMVPEIIWDGTLIPDLDFDLLENLYSYDNNILSIPRSTRISEGILLKDTEGNIGTFGFLQYQVGLNIYKDTPFQDLDIVKCGKGIFP